MTTNRTINQLCLRLRILLKEAVKRNRTQGILFSGGLDTSILAVFGSKLVKLKAFTIALQGAPAPDIKYAILMANNLQLEHIIHFFDRSELYDAIRRVIELRGSFDPMEVRNSVTIHIGLKRAREEGVKTIMTGDGCDELFAGYSFLFDLEREPLKLALRKLWSGMSFSSVPLAKALGVEVKLPYFDPDLMSFAKKLDSRYKIREVGGRRRGKWILRKAFEGILPEEVLWRAKMPIEQGSGTSTLPELFDKEISNTMFEEKRRKYLESDKVVIRDKEQLFYYDEYRSSIGIPHTINPKGKICPQCNSNVVERANYCRICGGYPI